jgi:hypothetical protein
MKAKIIEENGCLLVKIKVNGIIYKIPEEELDLLDGELLSLPSEELTKLAINFVKKVVVKNEILEKEVE